MKVLIICCCVFTLVFCGTMKNKGDDIPTHFMDMVKRFGYSGKFFDVQTEDGYILALFRITKSLSSEESSSSSQEKSSSSDERSSSSYGRSSSSSKEDDEKRPVLMMHGLMTNSESFLYGGPSESLALKLVDEGYDVFLGNARGTMYGQRHTTLDPKKDAAFWKFSWDEIGTKDIPAHTEKVLSVTGKKSMTFIGHNEGSTAFLVMASEKPEYQKKFDRHISLGPMAFMKNARDEVVETILDHYTSKPWIMKNVGMNRFTPTHELIDDAVTKCINEHNDEHICKNAFFVMMGYNSKHLNKTTVSEMMTRVPSTASAREILHLAQLKKSGKFQSYSDESNAHEYDLSKVTVPVAMFYTPKDPHSAVEDVKFLGEKLHKVFKERNFDEMTNNLDLLWSEKVKDVKKEVMDAMKGKLDKMGDY